MTDREIKVKYKLSPRQTEAYNALESDQVQKVLYGGAKGGGKSVLGCIWVFLRCLDIIQRYKLKNARKYPIPVGFMGRQQSVDFSNTTLETWKQVIPSDAYELKLQSKEIVIFKRVKIRYGGIGDREVIEKFNSAEYSFFFLDQAEEISLDDVGMLRGTLRLKIKGKDVPAKELFTANPAQCWLKREFLRPDLPEDTKFVQALPSDNPFLHKEYVSQLTDAFKHRPELLQAYLYGNWDALEGPAQLIKARWVEAAQTRRFFKRDHRIFISCDPARYGDDETVIYIMDDTDIVEQEIYGQKDTMFTANTLHTLALRHKVQAVAIDTIGVGGGVADRLREMCGSNYRVIDVTSSEKSAYPDRYYNVRAEMWDQAAKMFSEGDVSLDFTDDTLEEQLTAPSYELRNGRLLVESKDDIKAKLGCSPGRADAYIQGLYVMGLIPPGDQKGKRGHSIDAYRSDPEISAMAM